MTSIEDAMRRAEEVSRLYAAMNDIELAHALAFGFLALMDSSDHAARAVNDAITDILASKRKRISGNAH